MRLAQLAVPTGDGGPVRRRGEPYALYAPRERRHIRLGKRLRHVARRPAQERTPVSERHVCGTDDGVAERVAKDGVADGVDVRLVDGNDRREDRCRVFKHVEVGPRPPHARLARTTRVTHVPDLAHGKSGNGTCHASLERIDDVRAHAGVVGSRLHKARKVDRPHLPVRADDLHAKDRGVAVASVERDGERRVRPSPFLGKNLHPFVVPRAISPIRCVGGVKTVVYHDGVCVWETFRRSLRCRRDRRGLIGAICRRHVGNLAGLNNQRGHAQEVSKFHVRIVSHAALARIRRFW